MEPLSKRHKLDITLEDIAKQCHITMHTIYADIKRGKLDKNDIESIMEYIQTKRQSITSENGLII